MLCTLPRRVKATVSTNPITVRNEFCKLRTKTVHVKGQCVKFSSKTRMLRGIFGNVEIVVQKSEMGSGVADLENQ
jgi:hypothetical protein